MASITLTVPDAHVARIVKALRASYPVDAGMADAAVVKFCIVNWVARQVADYEMRQAQDAVMLAQTKQVTIT